MIHVPIVLTSAHDIKAACDRFSEQPFVAVDTEFMRQTTYRPILCLIQMAAPGIELIIDPIGLDANLTPFYELMANERVIKVFHAARQDIEIVYQEARVIPRPLFDTQIAGMALGYGDAIAYGALVHKILRRDHDKTYQAVDWCVRPLTAKQLDYAIGDVTHLRDIYIFMTSRLEALGRVSWLDEELMLLTDQKTYAFDPADAWKRLKLGGKSRSARGIIIELAAWRERTAQTENVPRGRILKDEAIYEIAKHAPRTLEALSRLRAVRDGIKGRGDAIIKAIDAGLARKSNDIEDPSPADFPASMAASVELLRVLLKAVCAKLDIAPKLLAGSDDLEKLVMADDADAPILKGWRKEHFGDQALALKNGTLAMGIRSKEIVLLPVAREAGEG